MPAEAKKTTMGQGSFPELKTERLLLRKLVISDWEMVSYLRTDKAVNKFVRRSAAGSKEAALEFIAKTNEATDRQELYYWCICTKDKPDMIGSICLWNFSEDQKTAEIGYDLAPAFHGKGLMHEAMNSVLALGFTSLDLDTIEAYTHRKNSPSKKLLERNGFMPVEGKADPDNKDNMVFQLVDCPR